MLKWITHKIASSSLESRGRLLQSKINDLDEQREASIDRVHREGEQLHDQLESLVSQREQELQEAVVILNRHLASSQDMFHALQRYTQQIYVTLEAWLQYQVCLEADENAWGRIKLLEERGFLLEEAEKGWRILSDEMERGEWFQAQPELAPTIDKGSLSSGRLLKGRRDAIGERYDAVKLALKRIRSEQRSSALACSEVESDLIAARSELKQLKSAHQVQREALEGSFLRCTESWSRLRNDPFVRTIKSLREEAKESWREFEMCREVSCQAKAAVTRAHEEEDYSNFDAMKEARERAYREQDRTFRAWRLKSREIEEFESRHEELLTLIRRHWDDLDPYQYSRRVAKELDRVLQDPNRRRMAIYG